MPGVPVPLGYVRPDPEPHPDLPATKKSKACPLNDGSVKHYPALSDYLEYYVTRGIVKDYDDLVQNKAHLIGEAFVNWVRSGQLGCLFAVQLAKHPRENRWFPIVQLGALTEGSKIGGLLNTELDAAGAGNEAAVVIFPDVLTVEEIVDLVNALCADPSGRWYRTDDGIKSDDTGKLAFVGLRWILPSGESVNYVLGFAPVDGMPQTRQSPFTALFLRIRDEKRTPSHREDGRVQVHLADLDSTFHPQAVHDEVWRLTEATRANHVEPHMSAAARAKITFTIPIALASKLSAARKVKIEKDGEDAK